MSFHEVQFPTNLSFGAMGGPERRSEIVTLTNGFEERNTPWAHSRRRFDAGMGLRSLEDIEAAVAFFEARQGQIYGFRWKDWSDYRSATAKGEISEVDQIIGVGDETQMAFQLVKTYRSGSVEYERPITKPVEGTVLIAVGGQKQVEGQDFTVDHASGIVSFDHPPDVDATISAGFEFDVPVRFDTDRIFTSVATFQAGEVPDIPVVEVRV